MGRGVAIDWVKDEDGIIVITTALVYEVEEDCDRLNLSIKEK